MNTMALWHCATWFLFIYFFYVSMTVIVDMSISAIPVLYAILQLAEADGRLRRSFSLISILLKNLVGLFLRPARLPIWVKLPVQLNIQMDYVDGVDGNWTRVQKCYSSLFFTPFLVLIHSKSTTLFLVWIHNIQRTDTILCLFSNLNNYQHYLIVFWW